MSLAIQLIRQDHAHLWDAYTSVLITSFVHKRTQHLNVDLLETFHLTVSNSVFPSPSFQIQITDLEYHMSD